MASKMLAVGALLASASALQLGQLIENEKLDSSVDELIEELDAGTVDLNELEMLPDDPFEADYKPRGEIERPRMLAMRGCSGSSAVMVFARNLLRFHGIPVSRAAEPRYDDDHIPIHPRDWQRKSDSSSVPAELLNPSINWMYEPAGDPMHGPFLKGDIGQAMVKMNSKIRERNQTLFFKGMIQHLQGNALLDDEFAELKDEFKKLKMYAVLGTRSNMLDQVICQVKDCFVWSELSSYGVPVHAKSGKKSDLCFDRRGETNSPNAKDRDGVTIGGDHSGKQSLVNKHSAGSEGRSEMEEAMNSSAWFWVGDDNYKAKLNITNLMKSIHTEFKYVENARKSLESIGYKFEIVNEEDLLEFQTPMKGAFKRGVTAWSTLLKSFGVTPSEKLVKKFLFKYAKTYSKTPTHKDVIYNFDEVRKALKGTKHERLIRH